MRNYHIIGVMSGTSMDGVDIAWCHFTESNKGKWSWELLQAEAYSYPEAITKLLLDPFSLSGMELSKLNVELGATYADMINRFIKEKNIDKSKVDAIAIHGQTIFHQPQNGFTTQIGAGTKIAVETKIKVINNFRNKDVYLGGQGAPLVPIGDFLLFEDRADSFLNIGGFCNLSYKENDKIVAFDVCPGNLPLNKLANSKGKAFDEDGKIATQGEINFFLLNLLNNLPFYKQEIPKSLGTEWLETEFYPLIKFNLEVEDNMRTVVEHIAIQISDQINKLEKERVLITGGGAKNEFLIERIKNYSSKKLIIPDDTLIDYKEAIVFGFLGALYLAGENNVLKSVTGASRDSMGGVLHLP